MIAAKHFDPQLGIDIHTYLIPPSPIPIPLPTPHIGIVLDPFDYLPFIGGTVKVNGIHKATAGTGGLCAHIPVGGVWMPTTKMPAGVQFDDEVFMGSKTVSADGEPFSRLGMPVLDCNLIGMIPPFRRFKPKKPTLSLTLPTTVNLALPTNVVVGGPPTVSWTALGFRAAFAGLGKLAKLKAVTNKLDQFKKWRQDKWGHLNPGFLKCNILRAEPVDIRDGSVSVEYDEFDIPGRLPLVWSRQYSSRDHDVDSSCGHGWQTSADLRLVIEEEGRVSLLGPGQMALFPALPEGNEQVLDAVDGARLLRQGNELVVRFKNGLRYCFAEQPQARTLPITRIEDASANHWRFERDAGKLLRIAESGIEGAPGRFIDVECDGNRLRALTLHDPATGINHPLVAYRYEDGNLLEVIDPLGVPHTFTYVQHYMVKHTDCNGLAFHYAYNAKRQVVHAWGDGGWYDYRFVYDEILRQTEVTDSLGHLSVVKFDAYGLPIAEIDPLDGVTCFAYDDFARTVGITDPEGLHTAFAYDERGNLLSITRPDDSTICYEYDGEDRLIAHTGPMGERWTRTNDTRGLPASQTDPVGAVTHFEHDALGQLIRHIDPRGAVTQIAYDRRGYLARLTDPLGHVSRFEHDARGRLLAQTNVVGQQTRYHYDTKGRLLRIDQPDGTQISCAYDAEDQLIRYVDAAGAETRLEYVCMGQISKRIQPDGHTIHYHYDSEEQLIGVTNQRGERYELRRDPLGRIVEEVDYWGQARRYEYDAAGRLKASIDPLGQRIAYTTDQLGRITRKTLPDVLNPGQQIQEHFVYDKSGRLTELRNPASQVKRRFDPAGQLLEELQNGFCISWQYDETGHRTLRETSAGNRLACSFDLRGQVNRIAINDEAPIVIERDALGRTTQEQLGERLQRHFDYDERSLLTAQTVLDDARPLFETRYAYDRAGNLTRRHDSQQGTDEYCYDVLGRLLEHIDPRKQIEQFYNDPAGDRLQTRIQQIRQRQAAGGESQADDILWTREGSYQGVHYIFDRAGNLVRKGRPRTDQDNFHKPSSIDPDDLELRWDANHRLAQSKKNGNTTSYGYDPLGRRSYKRSATHTTHFFWDGDALLAEVTQPNEEIVPPPRAIAGVVSIQAARLWSEQQKRLHQRAREYVYYPGSFIPLARVDRSEPKPADKKRAAASKTETKPVAAPQNPRPPAPSIAASKRETPAAKKTVTHLPATGNTASLPGASGLGMLGGNAGLGGAAPSLRIDKSEASEPAPTPPARPALSTSGALGGICLGGTASEAGKKNEAQISPPTPEAVRKTEAPTVAAQAEKHPDIPPPPAPEKTPAAEQATSDQPEPSPSSLPAIPRVLYYHVDPNGCPTRLTDQSGTTLWSASYSAWGEITTRHAQATDNPLRYQGQYFDEESGLHYNRYRYYDPHAGQFVGQDPIGLNGGLNVYQYGDNAFGWVDPLGLQHIGTKGSSQADAVIAETLAGKGDLTSTMKLSADVLLEAGQKFIGPGYKEIGKSGSGVFRSADGTRQFRIDNNSLSGNHSPGVPHGHLETYAPGAAKPTTNNHIPFFD